MTLYVRLGPPMNFQSDGQRLSLVIAPFSGHSAFEKEITHELIMATNKFGGVDS